MVWKPMAASFVQTCLLLGARRGAHAFSSKNILAHSSPRSKMRNLSRKYVSSTSTATQISDMNTMTGSKEKDEQLVQDMLYRVRQCNNITPEMRTNIMDFVIDGAVVGKVTTQVANLLCNSSPSPSNPVFEIIHTENQPKLTLSPNAGSTIESRSESVMSVMLHLKSRNIITGWRDETYALSTGYYNEPLLFVERAAACWLGMLQYGVHINGLVRTNDDDTDTEGKGEEKMWIARRSATKSQYPGMTDQIVAGGQPQGLGLMENVLKECQEEAGIPDDLTLKGIRAAGAVSYEGIRNVGPDLDVISRVVLFCYDLQLPPDFVPKVVDGEVEEFFQWSVQEQFASMARDFDDPMKPNCYLNVIDYLLRKGEISPETPGYLELLKELRSGDCA